MSDTHKPFRPLIVITGVVVGMFVLSAIRKANEPKDNIPWRKDWSAARAESVATHKPLFVYFTATWCGPCQEMKVQTFADKRVEERLSQSVIPVKIDVDDQPQVAMEFGVNGIPQMDLVPLGPAERSTRVGFISADELLRWLSGS